MVNKLVKVLHIEKMEGGRERSQDMERHSIGLVPNRVFSVTIVKDSYHAFDLLAMKNYDVIVISEVLDDMSAQETAQIIRNSNQSIPLLLLAAEEETSIEYRLIEIQKHGFSHVLVSPYTNDDYFRAIDAMCVEKTRPTLSRHDQSPPTLSMNSERIDVITQLALERFLQQQQRACQYGHGTPPSPSNLQRYGPGFQQAHRSFPPQQSTPPYGARPGHPSSEGGHHIEASRAMSSYGHSQESGPSAMWWRG